MLNYSVHTYQLFAKLSYDEYWQITKKLFELNVSVEYDPSRKAVDYGQSPIVRKSHYFRKLKMPGILEIHTYRVVTLSTEYEGDVCQLSAGIYIKINPFNALHSLDNSTHEIVDSRLLESTAKYISGMLYDFLGEEIHQKLKLCRCDFCVNLPFDNAEKASLYVRLLQKSVPSPTLKEPTHIDERSHHITPVYPDSLLLECKSFSFEVYNKQKQMVTRGIGDDALAEGIVRIELRAGKNKLKTLFKIYGGSPKDYIPFFADVSSICSIEVLDVLIPMVGTGDFLSYKVVKQLILKRIKKEHWQKAMIFCVDNILKRKRCNMLLSDCDIDYQMWKKILAHFDKIGCSPITIPVREGVDYLPGILSWDDYFK